MLASSIPSKFVAPFANAAGAGFIRAIPATQPVPENGQASLATGFPSETFQPPSAGGYAPDGRDFNGLLFQISAWNEWQSAGGPVKWDSSFSTSIGGYPQGAVVQSATTLGLQWLCTADNNTSNPDSSGANWVAWPLNLYAVDSSGAANTVTASFAPLTGTIIGLPVRVKVANTNTGATTLNTVAVKTPNGAALADGALQAGGVYTFVYDGTSYQLQGVGAFSATFVSAPTAFPTAGTVLTLAHGLGGLPFGYQAYLHCVTNDSGYIAGQELNYTLNGNNSSNEGFQMHADATDINIIFAAVATLDVLNPSTGNSATITNGNWAIVVRAWR